VFNILCVNISRKAIDKPVQEIHHSDTELYNLWLLVTRDILDVPVSNISSLKINIHAHLFTATCQILLAISC